MLERTRTRRRVWLPLGAAFCALVAAGPARAADPPRPDDVSAADAYRESLPTAAGPRPTGSRGRAVPVSAQVAARLGKGESLLRDVIASPAYAAPQRTLRPPARNGAASTSVLSAAGTSVGDAVGRGRIALLGGLLVAIGAGALAVRLAPSRSA